MGQQEPLNRVVASIPKCNQLFISSWMQFLFVAAAEVVLNCNQANPQILILMTTKRGIAADSIKENF